MTILTLKIISAPDGVSTGTRTVTGQKFTIGRDPGCDWCLTDKNRVLSKKHCYIEHNNNHWNLIDTSTNGTFMNQDTLPLKKEVRELRNGDTIEFAAYKIKVVVSEAEPLPVSESPAHKPTSQYDNDRLVGDIFDPHEDDAQNLVTSTSTNPFTTEDNISINPGLRVDASPTVQENSPLHSAFKVPAAIPEVIGDDWNQDPIEETEEEEEDYNSKPEDHTHQPGYTEQAHYTEAEKTPVWEDIETENGETSLTPQPVSEEIPQEEPQEHYSETYVSETGYSSSYVPSFHETSETAAEAAPEYYAEHLTAFLEGADLVDTIDVSQLTPQTMAELGKSFRAIIHGLRQIMIARATIKGEFRIEQTMIQAAGNNPLKFSANDDDALMAMIGIGRQSGMIPSQAIAESLNDMSLHEFAVVNAMQSAVMSLLDRIEPERFRENAGNRFMDFCPDNKAGRAFELYVTKHKELITSLQNDSDSSFSKDFARSYEKALTKAETSHKNRTDKASETRSSAKGEKQ